MRQVKFQDWLCTVELRRYGNGRPALILNDVRDGEEVAVATVNLADVPAAPDEAFIKDYAENTGMLAALEAAGVVQATGDGVSSGFSTIPRAKLSPVFLAQAAEQMQASGEHGRDSAEKPTGRRR